MNDVCKNNFPPSAEKMRGGGGGGRGALREIKRVFGYPKRTPLGFWVPARSAIILAQKPPSKHTDVH